MDDSDRAELEALRAENARLRQQNSELHPEQRARMDGALHRAANDARREANAYQAIQAQGLTANVGQPSEVAYQAADFLIESGLFG